MGQFLIVPRFLNWGLFGSVDDGSPSQVDTDHQAGWLVDGRQGFPLRLTGPDGAVTVTNPAGAVGLVAICHHLLDAGVEVDISGSVTGQIVMPPLPRNGVPLNAWTLVDVATASATGVTLTFTAAGSPAEDILVGEAVIASFVVLDPSPRLEGSQFGERQYIAPRSSALSGIPPYSERARSRTIRGSNYYDQAGLDTILAIYDSQDSEAYPIPLLIIPDSDNPYDARLVMMSEPTHSQVRQGSTLSGDPLPPLYLVELEFTELPRTRW